MRPPAALPDPPALLVPPMRAHLCAVRGPAGAALCLLLGIATTGIVGGQSIPEAGRVGAMPSGGSGAVIDTARTRIGFNLKTRWGQALHGRFQDYEGKVEALADGRRRIHLRLSARTVTIDDHPHYTRYTRGEGFFDAERYPEVTFVSAPYDSAMLRSGGKLSGMLRIRDVQRSETFEITATAATCARPGYDCDVAAVGSVRRSDYGVDRWIFAVTDTVRFNLRLRLHDETGGDTP